MSTDSEHQRPSFRFRDKFSRLKERVKDKVRDKAIRHNITQLIHQNLTSNETTDDHSRHGFRQNMHNFKDVLKNKTHYASIKDKIKDKIDEKFDLHDNKTYPKGFYDSLFSPETENDVYLQTALICLWVIALLCIIPTIIIIFLPTRKKNAPTTSTNMIFFHVFFCELCYLSYVLLAMINVAKDFRLASIFCDFANYGMYVTIPIMQFALLFLSLERLSKHFNLSMTWAKIFTKPYLIQVILCAIWIFLIALLVTFMFIRKQFSFNFIKDQVSHLAPPILGDVASRLASRRHHCSIDGRLSSVFKTLIIILFIILIVKPILFSLGFNLLSPFCCKKRRIALENHGDRRTTKLVTIFLLLNLFFSFPFYFTSMFKSIFTRIDSTKDTFSIILKICFILRITNIIFECLAFYIFERNSWNILSKLFYYGTCKKFPIFKSSANDDVFYTKDPAVLDIINETRDPSDDDDDEDRKPVKKKRITKKPVIESEPDDDDGGFRTSKRQSTPKKVETPVETDEEAPIINRDKQSKKKIVQTDEDSHKNGKSQKKKLPSDDDEDEDEDEEEETERKSRTKKPVSDDEKRESTTKRKSRSKVEAEEEKEFIEKPKSKSRRTHAETRIPNGTSTSHRPSSATNPPKTTKSTPRHSTSAHAKPERRPTPSETESEADTASDVSETSVKMIKPSPSKPIKTHTAKTRLSSPEQNRTHSVSPSPQRHRSRVKPTTTNHSQHATKKHRSGTSKKSTNHPKKAKKDRQTRILEMSDEV